MKATSNNLIKRDDKILVFKFASSTTVSDPVYIGGIAGFGIMPGVGWVSGDITVQVGLTQDGPFGVLKDKDDAAYTLTSVDVLDPRTVDANIYPWHWCRLVSSTAQALGTEVHGAAKT